MNRSLIRRHGKAGLLVWLVLPWGMATASPPISDAHASCNEQAVGMDGLADCAEAELARQEARLQAALHRLTGRLPAERAARLQQAQAHWLSWRQSQCAFAADPDSDTLAPMQQLQCHITMTTRRADALASQR